MQLFTGWWLGDRKRLHMFKFPRRSISNCQASRIQHWQAISQWSATLYRFIPWAFFSCCNAHVGECNFLCIFYSFPFTIYSTFIRLIKMPTILYRLVCMIVLDALWPLLLMLWLEDRLQSSGLTIPEGWKMKYGYPLVFLLLAELFQQRLK